MPLCSRPPQYASRESGFIRTARFSQNLQREAGVRKNLQPRALSYRSRSRNTARRRTAARTARCTPTPLSRVGWRGVACRVLLPFTECVAWRARQVWPRATETVARGLIPNELERKRRGAVAAGGARPTDCRGWPRGVGPGLPRGASHGAGHHRHRQRAARGAAAGRAAARSGGRLTCSRSASDIRLGRGRRSAVEAALPRIISDHGNHA